MQLLNKHVGCIRNVLREEKKAKGGDFANGPDLIVSHHDVP